MPRLLKSSQKIYFCILHFIFCILIWGCFNPFSPSVIGPSALKPIAPQVNPDSVLYNLKYAYENRDSIVYENCLDEEFSFTYWDQDNVQGIVITEFPRPIDLKVTKDLFRFFDEIRLDEWRVMANADSIVGDESWKKRNVSYNLLVWQTSGQYSYQAIGQAEFFFRKSKKDDWWRIIRWIDMTL